MKQMREEEPFCKTIHITMFVRDIFQMLTPMDACIPPVFCKIFIETFIDIGDFGVEFRGIVYYTYVATQSFHHFEAADGKFSIVF